jgi:hypothetical protein
LDSGVIRTLECGLANEFLGFRVLQRYTDKEVMMT